LNHRTRLPGFAPSRFSAKGRKRSCHLSIPSVMWVKPADVWASTTSRVASSNASLSCFGDGFSVVGSGHFDQAWWTREYASCVATYHFNSTVNLRRCFQRIWEHTIIKIFIMDPHLEQVVSHGQETATSGKRQDSNG